MVLLLHLLFKFLNRLACLDDPLQINLHRPQLRLKFDLQTVLNPVPHNFDEVRLLLDAAVGKGVGTLLLPLQFLHCEDQLLDSLPSSP